MADPLVLPAGLEQDPEIYDALKQLALDAIESARDNLRRSAPSIQLQVVRLVLPSVSRALANQRDDSDDDLKEAVDAMYADVRKAIGVMVPDA